MVEEFGSEKLERELPPPSCRWNPGNRHRSFRSYHL